MNVGVYGLGRFGQFWAMTLQEMGFSVCGYNRSDRPLDSRITRVSLEELCSCDVIFLCTAISSIPDVAGKLKTCISPNTLIVDTCSVKLYPLGKLSEILGETQPVLGTHPMFGPDSARDGVAGLPIVVSEWRAGDTIAAFWAEKFAGTGMRVIQMTADEHDREAARTQGVTHFIGRFLSNLELSPSDIGTVGFGKIFEVMEQTCNDPWQLFLDLQRFNPYTSDMRKRMQDSFGKIMSVLDSLDPEM